MNNHFIKMFGRITWIYTEIASLCKSILGILYQFDYQSWHKASRFITEEELVAYIRLYSSFTQSPEDLTESPIGNPVEGVIDFLEMFQRCYGNDYVISLISEIAAVEHNKQICNTLNNLLEGVRPQKLTRHIIIKLYTIFFWFEFKMNMDSITTNYSQVNSLNLRSREFALQQLEGCYERLSNIEAVSYSKPMQDFCLETIQMLDITHNLLNKPSIEKSDIPTITLLARQCYDSFIDQFNQLKEALYQFLNNVFIPLSIRKRAALCVQESKLSSLLQHEYSLRRTYRPQIINLSLSKVAKIETNSILPEDFKSGKQKEKMGMKLDYLSHSNIVSLYHALIGKYISKDTDILDLSYALTGFPTSQKDVFRKVNWIHPHKQTLGLFLGMLCPYDKDVLYGYWSLAPHLFFCQSKDRRIKAGQLSSPYGKMARHIETRTKDWYDIEAIISSCRIQKIRQ